MKDLKLKKNYGIVNGIRKLKNNKPFLIVVPAGDNSYHKSWYNSSLYDLFVIYFGNNEKIEKDYKNKSDYFLKRKGPKWQLIRYVFTEFDFDWDEYQYIWLPDDDLKISKEDVEEFLIVSQNLKLKLSQPSLRPLDLSIENQLKIINDFKKINKKSERYYGWVNYLKDHQNENTEKISLFISYKNLLQQYSKNEKKIRYTNFVEIMCPLFEINFFKKAFEYINKDYVQSGFGLDKIWAKMLNYKNAAVIDFISVIHTRPVGIFKKEKTKERTGNFKVLTIDPKIEEEKSIKEFEKNTNKILKKVYIQTIKTTSLLKNNKKIAFLFLTRGDVNFPNIWEKYFLGNEDKYNIYIHPKEKNNVKSFMKYHIIDNIISTKWGDISIVKSINSLLKQAIKDPENKSFCILSESCLPIRNFNFLYKNINFNKTTFKSMKIDERTLRRFDYLKNPEKLGINKNTFKKAETWSILNRKHVINIINNQDTFLKTFNDVYVPEEHFYITLLNLKNPKDEFVDESTTIVYLDESGPLYKHPKTFGPNISEKYKKIIYKLIKKNKSAFFMRKFKNDKNENVSKIILNLIRSS